jgi:hypothetical protein
MFTITVPISGLSISFVHTSPATKYSSPLPTTRVTFPKEKKHRGWQDLMEEALWEMGLGEP